MVADVLVRPLRWLARAATGLAALAAAMVLGAGLAAPATAAPAAVGASASASTVATTAADETPVTAAPASVEAAVAVAPVAGAHEADRDAVGRWERSATGRRGPPVGE